MGGRAQCAFLLGNGHGTLYTTYRYPSARIRLSRIALQINLFNHLFVLVFLGGIWCILP